ncbi:MAG: EcsC family protein [Candidatus Hinthialibacter antarcticus]|nr:EcsC family protein [Candidatus Hinthialibacter antarcticus]
MAISLPLYLWALLAMFTVTGILFLGRYTWQWLRLFLLIRRGLKPLSQKEREGRLFSHLSDADRQAQELIDQRVKHIWRTVSKTHWFDLEHIRDDCFALIRDVAAAYYPNSNRPEYEASLYEILLLSERVHREIKTLIAPIAPLQKVSVKHLLQTKEIFEKTQTVIDKRGVRTGRRIINAVWTAVNVVNPQYWVSRAIYLGASEMAGRKALASIYRIVGVEAMKTYRSSSTIRPDEVMLKDLDHSVSENLDNESIQPDIIMPEESSHTPVQDEMSDLQTIKTEEDMPPEWNNENNQQSTLYENAAKTLSLFIEGSLHLWEKLASPAPILKKYAEQNPDIHTLHDIQRLPAEQIEAIAKTYRKQGEWLSAVEGVATGAGGFLLMGVDAASLLALQLRTIQQIGYCYGFDVTQPEEKLFAVKLLVEGYTHPMRQDRRTLLEEMRAAAKLMKTNSPLGLLQKRMFVQGLTKAAQKIGISMGGRKTAQVLPFIGAAVGGVMNKKITKDIAKIAQEVYHDRLLQLKEAESAKSQPE